MRHRRTRVIIIPHSSKLMSAGARNVRASARSALEEAANLQALATIRHNE